MNYDTITKHLRMPTSHPVLCELTIDAENWYRFECLNEETPGTRILRHGDPKDGVITVSVACASEDVKEALENGWA